MGYSLPVPDPSTSYEEVVEAFEWDVPASFNIGGTVRKPDPSVRDATALVHVDEDGRTHEFTYADLDAAAASLGAHLRDEGLESGDRIALCFPQSPELLVAHLATYRIGCIAVPLSVLLGSDSVHHSIADSGARAVVADARVRSELDTVLREFDLVVDLAVDLDGTQYRGSDRHLGGYADRVQRRETGAIAETSADDPAIIVYTSGTTGEPKGVVQAHQYLIGSLPGYQLWFHLFGDRHRERVWTPAEWSWAGALFDVVFPTLELGGTVVSRVRRSGFDPERTLELLEGRSVSRAFMPPTALWQIRDQSDPSAYDLSALDVLLSGGEQLSTPLHRWAERALDVVVNESYGQTEANALIGNCQALFEHRDGSMGRAYPGHDCRLVDEAGRPVDDGELGEIALTLPDPVVFQGYWGDEGSADDRFADGLYLTGDLATRDEDGYFRFAGRRDDLIITAGYRVGPAEVESALCAVPAVTDAAVGGVPDEERGQRIKAFVLVDDGDTVSTDNIRRAVRDRIGAHKAPDEVVVLDDVPQTRSGKLDRSALFPS